MEVAIITTTEMGAVMVEAGTVEEGTAEEATDGTIMVVTIPDSTTHLLTVLQLSLCTTSPIIIPTGTDSTRTSMKI